VVVTFLAVSSRRSPVTRTIVAIWAMCAFPDDDGELLELIWDLQEQRSEELAAALSHDPVRDYPVADALRAAEAERRQRQIPDVLWRGENHYEVRWGEPGGDSVTIHTERFTSKDAALRRALVLRDAFRKAGFPEGWP